MWSRKSQWVSPVQVVPKKTGFTVVANERNELVPMQVQNSWRVCIDYRRLNQATRKDHFPLSFIDQMLERLAGKSHYCFLDGFSVGAVLSQRVEKKSYVIAYASRTLDNTQANYTTTEKELLTIVLPSSSDATTMDCQPIRDDFPDELLYHLHGTEPC
ncbi:uncharacterized protein LOC127799723 [Diospyros lotus]|uniref:uncharacterized protein LOC127799723 n=1 Tax=Diospyros lotus TaxID=55363 RepID=UPI002254968A|nr:uncharacterized protein LOC127799723 [Diospyros lotus]